MSDEVINIDELADAVADRLADKLPLDHGRMWKPKDVGRYIGRSERIARSLLKRPDAPRPYQASYDGSQTSIVYDPDEIKPWWKKISQVSAPSQPPSAGNKRAAS